MLLRRIEKHRYFPAGKTTTPPPAPAAASMALLMAFVSSVLPSPVAPNLRTSKMPSIGTVATPSCAEATYETPGIAAAAMPIPPVRRKSRRIELNGVIGLCLLELDRRWMMTQMRTRMRQTALRQSEESIKKIAFSVQSPGFGHGPS